MRKFHGEAESSIARQKTSNVPMLIFMVLVMLISPFIYESGSIVLAQWQSLYGTHWEPKTPFIDAVTDYARDFKQEIRHRTNRTMLAGNWNPSLAIPLAVSWAALGAFFLRRGK